MSSRHVRVAAALAAGAAFTGPVAAHAVPTSPAAARVSPRDCYAEYTVADSTGRMFAVAYDGTFATQTYPGAQVAPRARFVEPILIDPDRPKPVMATLVVTREGLLQSVTSTLENPDTDRARWTSTAPVGIGHGWGAVRDIAVPAYDDAPYMYALLGNQLKRYTVRTTTADAIVVRGATAAATRGFGGVRALTWTRETRVGGTTADVLVALAGNRLMEYTVPRTARPTVVVRTLATRGWGGVSQIHAGACFTSSADDADLTTSTPMLGIVRSDVRLYLDADNRDGSGRDIVNFGRVGSTPRL